MLTINCTVHGKGTGAKHMCRECLGILRVDLEDAEATIKKLEQELKQAKAIKSPWSRLTNLLWSKTQ